MDDFIHRYVQFIFKEYRKNPYSWITKHPPSIAKWKYIYDDDDEEIKDGM